MSVAACSSTVTGGGAGATGGQAVGSGGTLTGSGGSPGSGGSSTGGSTQPGSGGSGGTTSGTGGTGANPGSGGSGATGGDGSGGTGAAQAGSGGTGAGATAGMAGRAGRGMAGSTGSGGSGAGGMSMGASGTGGSVSGGAGAAPVGTMTTPGMGCTPPSAYNNLFVSVSGHTQADSDSKVAAAWSSLFDPTGKGTIFYNGPGSDESYVEDTYNNDVRTEGMSYGMMIAVQLDHQTEFDRLWAFVKAHMAQGTTGQIAWHTSTSGSKLATGGAPDGDEYFAAALVFAHTRWGDTSGKYNYGTEAQWVLDLIRTQDFDKNSHIVEFYVNAGHTDGSYVLPAFYQTWACFDTANADFWNAAVTAGRTFFHNAIDSNGVIGDQSSYTGQTVQGPGADTIRCVANIMMDHNFFDADSWQTDTYATKYGAYEQTHASGVAQQSCNSLLGFGLPASSGKAFVDKLWSTNPPSHDYWNGVLYMLAMVHVSGNFQLWY
ncbi:MAG TPA: glycosyl hydrolase family 8 [Polyangiaceae bacterium]|nr:glycosyl hydrolase family 8 [Polyangiaceae bacterium]